MAVDDSERTQEVQIDDPEELSQTKRIREILNRRQGVLEARDRAMDEMTLGDIGGQEALQHYQSRIESLVLDLYTKFKQLDIESESEAENSEDYLFKKKIDTVVVDPPQSLIPNERDIANGENIPEPKEETIEGLYWFIKNEPVIQKSFSVTSWNPPGVQTDTNARFVPKRTLDKALVHCMEFIDKAGIDAKFEQKEQRTKIDRELLEEVDEWRKENVNNK